MPLWIWMGALAAAGFVISLITNAVATGGALLVMPLLSLWFPARQVVVMATPMLWVNALLAWWNYRRAWRVRRALVTIPWVLVGLIAGVHLLKVLPRDVLTRLIGAIALLFAAYETWRRARERQPQGLASWWGGPVGIAAGIMSALSNIGGTLLSLYVLSPDTTPDGLVGSIAFLSVFMTSVKFVLYAGTFHRLMNGVTLVAAIPAVPAVWLGGRVGTRVHQAIHPARFRWIILGLVMVSGAFLLVTGG
ncbi:MAG: sulfite exporter TauE/SafE family protein [Firmicutes bacterium]|nr:sulfite exporter TauE/SafE family protein [Bacillota bacterium]